MLRSMMLLTVRVLAISLPLAFATNSLAGEKKDGKKKKKEKNGAESSYSAPYGMAGCGLGSVVIKPNDKMQIFAATLNVTGFQTSAISCSHSSNCKADKETAEVEQKVFISANLRAIEEDLSQGGGDYSFALAQVLGCDGADAYPEFIQTSRDNFDNIFSSSDPDVVYTHYIGALRANAKLVRGCDRVLVKS